MPQPKKDILFTIEDFKSFDEHHVMESTFLNGYCYDFAYMLQRTYGGDIVFIKKDCHFVLRIDGKYYDITGEVSVEGKTIEEDEEDVVCSVCRGTKWLNPCDIDDEGKPCPHCKIKEK